MIKFLRAIINRKSRGNDALRVEDLFELASRKCSESLMICIDGDTKARLFVKMNDKEKSVLMKVLPKLLQDAEYINNRHAPDGHTIPLTSKAEC